MVDGLVMDESCISTCSCLVNSSVDVLEVPLNMFMNAMHAQTVLDNDPTKEAD